MIQEIFMAIDKILFNDQRPWLMANQNEKVINRLIVGIQIVNPPFRLYWKFECDPPINRQVMYYQLLLDNYRNQMLHDINRILTSVDVPGFHLDRLFNSIKEELYTRLSQSDLVISSVTLGTCVLDSVIPKDKPNSQAETLFHIFHYVRLSIIQVLGEMHTHFRDKVRDILWMGGPRKPLPYIVPEFKALDGGYKALDTAAGYETGSEAEVNDDFRNHAVFVAILGDVRTPKEGIGLYFDMVHYPKRFGWFEELLFKHGFIDKNLKFRNQHGHKKLLGAIYHFLIEKDYFKNINDAWKKRIQPYDVRKFLDHRYQVNLKKQFELAAKRVDERADIIDSLDWLNSLPKC